MPYRLTALLLAATITMLASARPAAARSGSERSDADAARLTDRVKDGVRRLGTGPETRISVRRRNGAKLKGYLAAAGDAAFTVVAKSGETTQVQYSDVTQVKGHNLATGWKIAIGVGIGVAVTLLVLYIYIATHES